MSIRELCFLLLWVYRPTLRAYNTIIFAELKVRVSGISSYNKSQQDAQFLTSI